MNFDALRAMLVRDEGLKLRAYKDSVGIWTIGAGHNLEAKPISKRAAMVILDDDITDAIEDLDRTLPWWRDLSENRQHALVNMTFNLGIRGLCGFRKALAALRDGKYAEAADHFYDSVWAGQVGQRATRVCALIRDG